MATLEQRGGLAELLRLDREPTAYRPFTPSEEQTPLDSLMWQTLNNLRDPIIVIGPDVFFANQAFAPFSTRKAILDALLEPVVQTSEGNLSLLDAIMFRGAGWSETEVEVPEEGKYYRLRVSPMITEPARETYIIAHARDITDHKIEMARANEHVALAAHDFRNQLTAIKGNLFLALRELAKPHPKPKTVVRPYLDKVWSPVERLNGMINDVVEIFKLSQELKQEAVPVAYILEPTIQERRESIETQGIELEELPIPCLKIKADITHEKAMLAYVPGILLDNAIKAMNDNAPGTARKLIVSCYSNGSEIAIAVEDTGSGIPEQDRKRIFEGYSTGTKTGEGTGFGLQEARKIARAHGGELILDRTITQADLISRPELDHTGSRFVLFVPTCRD